MSRQLLTAALLLGLMGAIKLASAQADVVLRDGKIKHVLLISIDGLHALDVANYVKAQPASALDKLSEHGATFSNARTPANSDSFPGLLALVTGGSPRAHGLFYDYSYDRTIWAPDNASCSGKAGTQMIFDESIDVYVGGWQRRLQAHPNSGRGVQHLGKAVSNSGPREALTRRLIHLALAIAAGSEGATHSHARRARSEGISPEELEHVAVLAITAVGWSQAIKGLTWVRDVTRAQSDEADGEPLEL